MADLLPSKKNNFDLIRLFAAAQVVIGHGIEHLEIENTYLNVIFDSFLVYFPGVPIFFAVSGFLIFWSFDRNSDKVGKYFRNRFLRLFPALWACLIVTILILVIDSGLSRDQFFSKDLILWVIAQSTVFQFYTPDLLRNWGVGTPNGSLWTIVVEVQFYVLTPLLWLAFRKIGKKWYWLLMGLFTVSIISYMLFNQLVDESLVKKISKVFIIPYLYNFLIGVLFYIAWSRLRRVFEGKLLIWIVLYFSYSWFFSTYLGYYTPTYWPNLIGLIANIILVGLIFSLSFSYTNLSRVLLRGNDISYGVYIYHALVFNIFVSNSLKGSLNYFAVYFSIVLVMGYISWVCIEKPFLNLKSRARVSNT